MKSELMDLYEDYIKELLLLKSLVLKSGSRQDLELAKQTIVNSAKFLVFDLEGKVGKME